MRPGPVNKQVDMNKLARRAYRQPQRAMGLLGRSEPMYHNLTKLLHVQSLPRQSRHEPAMEHAG